MLQQIVILLTDTAQATEGIGVAQDRALELVSQLVNGGYVDGPFKLHAVHQVADQPLSLVVHLLGEHHFLGHCYPFENAGSLFAGALQRGLVAAIDLVGWFRILGIQALGDIDVDVVHPHPADFFNGVLFFDHAATALGVVRNPVVVQVGDVHADLERGDGDAFDHRGWKNVLRLLS